MVEEAGQLTGVVERVRTGEKHRFHDVEALGAVIRRMVRGDDPHPPDDRVPSPAAAADTGGNTPHPGPAVGPTIGDCR